MLERVKSVFGNALSALASFTRYGSPDDTPGGRWWVRWQNLSKDEDVGDAPLQGRAWLYLAPNGQCVARFSWNLLSAFAHIGAHVDPLDGECGFKVALPPVALWFSFESWPLMRKLRAFVPDEREIRFAFHDGSIWWSLWHSPNEWREGTPRWRQGSFSILDALLGPVRVTREQKGEPVAVKVPMPEGNYDARVSLFTVRVARPRWFSSYSHHAQITPETPIPEPGKGENSWDCDDDHVAWLWCEARTPAEAVSKLVSSVLRTREKRAGRDWMPPGTTPAPAPFSPPPPPAVPPSVPGVFGASPVAQA